jgi:hypothetical protein
MLFSVKLFGTCKGNFICFPENLLANICFLLANVLILIAKLLDLLANFVSLLANLMFAGKHSTTELPLLMPLSMFLLVKRSSY